MSSPVPSSPDLQAAQQCCYKILLSLNQLLRLARSAKDWNTESDTSLIGEIETLQAAVGCRPPIRLLSTLVPMPDPIDRCKSLFGRSSSYTHAGRTAPSAHALVVVLGADTLTTIFEAVTCVLLRAGAVSAAVQRGWTNTPTRKLWRPECREAVRRALLNLPSYESDALLSEMEIEQQNARSLLQNAKVPQPNNAAPLDRPVWDRSSRRLTIGADVIEVAQREAPSQFAILDLLQSAGWPSRGVEVPKNFRGLKDAVEALNNRLASTTLRNPAPRKQHEGQLDPNQSLNQLNPLKPLNPLNPLHTRLISAFRAGII